MLIKTIHHDKLAGYVANEHIDWTANIANTFLITGTLGAGAIMGTSLTLPTTTATTGIIYQNGEKIFHTFGTNNLLIGPNAGAAITDGDNNLLIGVSAGYRIEDGYSNLLFGYGCGRYIVSGHHNSAIGTFALGSVTGSYNTAFGDRAGYATAGSGSVFLGYAAGRRSTNSNVLVIDNQDRSTAVAEVTNCLIYGGFNVDPANQTLRINAATSIYGTSAFGDGTNDTRISAIGDIIFAGSAGFYPRYLEQADEPAAGTGATQCDTGEMAVWNDTDDNKVYLCVNDGGTVKTVELT